MQPTAQTTPNAARARFEVIVDDGIPTMVRYWILDTDSNRVVDPDWFDFGVREGADRVAAHLNAEAATGVEPKACAVMSPELPADVLARVRGR